jgi:hypothetical protein
MATVKKIYVTLENNELEYIKLLANNDGFTVDQMLLALCKAKIREEMEDK